MGTPFVLILGGSSEAASLAGALAADGRAGIVSLAGRTATPGATALPCRIGGFGGPVGLAAYLREAGIGALIDATHPFAATMTRHALAAAALTGIPFLRIDRPAWVAGPGDCWTAVADGEAAAAALGEIPRRVLLTVGRGGLDPFIALGRHRYVVRSVDPPARLPPDSQTILARGPFAEAGERALLRSRRIEVVVTKNAGGAATAAKLAACRTLGLPVVMIERPAMPAMPRVADVAGALAWLAAL